MATDAKLQAILQWVNAVRPGTANLDALRDGVILNGILTTTDESFFPESMLKEADNHVLMEANLKKLKKAIFRYYEELGHSLAPLDFDIAAIVKQSDDEQTYALLRLVFYTAINGNNNEFYVQSIGSLSGDVQKQLIEVTMEVNQVLESQTAPEDMSEIEALRAEVNRLKNVESELRETNAELEKSQKTTDELREIRDDLQSRLRETEESLSKASANAKDQSMRNELEKLRAEIRDADERRQLAEANVDEQNKTINELQRERNELQSVAAGARSLRDQLEEKGHLEERLLKAEAALNKSKKRAEEAIELKKLNKALSEEIEALKRQVSRPDASDTLATISENRSISQKALEDDVQALHKELEAARAVIKNLELENGDLKTDVDRLRAQIERLEQNKLEAAIAAASAEDDDSHSFAQIEESQRIRKENETIIALERQIRQLKIELQNRPASAGASNADVELSNVRGELERAKQDATKAEAEVSRINAELSKAQQEVVRLGTENSMFAKMKEDNKDVIGRMVEQATEFANKEVQLKETQLKAAQDRVARLEEDLKAMEELRTKNIQLQMHYQKVAEDNKNLKAAYTSLKSSAATASPQVGALSGSEVTLQLKEQVETFKVENKMMASAFYHLALELQSKGGSGARGGAGMLNGMRAAAMSSPTKAPRTPGPQGTPRA